MTNRFLGEDLLKLAIVLGSTIRDIDPTAYVVKSAKSARLGARAQRGAPIAPGGSLGAKMGFF
ncbi:hypothetical protein HanPSC8_Chr05g0228631 [Helianthus annuus]|nr:hypothetical protein HanPSC8_Chr05g0228631 [Helianthus annuus]